MRISLLDSDAHNASAPVFRDAPDDGPRQRRRADRYELRRTLWSESSINRLRGCGRWPVEAGEGVEVVRRTYGDGEGSACAHVAGVQTCGSPWACPVCAAKIRQRRAVEIEDVLTRHLEAGGGAQFLTLTMPHDQGDDLDALLDAVAYGWRRATGGRAWQSEKKRRRVLGHVRAVEVTHGPNGWHPHVHAVLLTEKPLPVDERGTLERTLYEPWARAVERRGYRRPARHLCPLEPVKRPGDLPGYVAGVGALATDNAGNLRRAGLVMMRADLKEGRESTSRGRGADRHRTPWEILGAFAQTGDVEELARWHAYEQATKGVRSISWSRGLRDAVDAGEEATDEEVAAEEVGGEVVMRLPLRTWKRLTREAGAVTELLRLVESGADGAAWAYVFEKPIRCRSGPRGAQL